MEKLQEEYMDKRKAYHGYNLSDDIHAIDAELVETVINKLDRGIRLLISTDSLQNISFFVTLLYQLSWQSSSN